MLWFSRGDCADAEEQVQRSRCRGAGADQVQRRCRGCAGVQVAGVLCRCRCADVQNKQRCRGADIEVLLI